MTAITKNSEKVLGVSVIICCYNSEALIRDTLKHLSLQEVRLSTPWEVILVDNASTDQTLELGIDYWKSTNCPAPLITLRQPIPGKTAGFNLALTVCNFEFVIMCDDDNWLEKTYIQRAFELMSAEETVGVIGGKGEPMLEDGYCPDWFNTFKKTYAVGAQEIERRPLDEKVVYGAGMVLRKAPIQYLLETNYEFQLSDRMPPAGNVSVAGGDYELCYVISLLRLEVKYDEGLQFRHYISRKRITPEYLKKQFNGYGITCPLLSPYLELLKARQQRRRVRSYFWIRDFLEVLASQCSLQMNKFTQLTPTKRMICEMDLATNRYAIRAYLQYNFSLTKRLKWLERNFDS